ncbi:hypothetical protein [Methylobacterium platani]|uniref:CopL family metal-binding regulatory protein n=2 Tax=Methylobacterium platani TaxID=427683 RepID=A0A179SJG0_9HYPH|nr:hypothetical protein [Methylobacterium platani]KMO17707.1 hypothetical protein SQ03_11895 [Methylobacterium platani JCM 14648]OAS27151.1 hypothetical protein A5481_01590 [Methylobacterium platani]
MSLDRQILRLMAAMILAIIAYAAPSAVQAHEGHAHRGHPIAMTGARAAPPVTGRTPTAQSGQAARLEVPARSGIARAPLVTKGARVEPPRDDCCPSGCRSRCCGTMACCATVILPGSPVLPPFLFRFVAVIPRDAADRSSPGPEALPEPPRTSA